MEYFLENWGSFVGVLSLIITIVGFRIAIRRATQARTASQEARTTITRVITGVDLERAIALIQRVKLLHREGKWEASSGHYQDLRHMLVDIGARHPEPSQELSDVLQGATAQISVIEVSVDRALRDQSDPRGAANFNRELNTIQANLERIASSTQFAAGEGVR